MQIFRRDNHIRKGYSVGIFSSENPDAIGIHSHEFIEIIFISKGHATHTIDTFTYEVERGDVLFINYGSIHAFVPSEGFRFVNFAFSPELAANAFITKENAPEFLSFTIFEELRGGKGGGRISFRGAECREIENLVNAMQTEYENDLPYSSYLVENYMGILMTKLLRKAQSESDSFEMDVWERIRQYIDERPQDEHSLSTLAKMSFYNPSYFSRMFKQKFGISLTDYIRKKKIELAIALLSEGALSVEQIALKCGFSDRSSFYHAFSKFTGKTPGEYKK